MFRKKSSSPSPSPSPSPVPSSGTSKPTLREWGQDDLSVALKQDGFHYTNPESKVVTVRYNDLPEPLDLSKIYAKRRNSDSAALRSGSLKKKDDGLLKPQETVKKSSSVPDESEFAEKRKTKKRESKEKHREKDKEKDKEKQKDNDKEKREREKDSSKDKGKSDTIKKKRRSSKSKKDLNDIEANSDKMTKLGNYIVYLEKAHQTADFAIPTVSITVA